MRCSPINAFEHTSVPYGDDGKLTRGIIARCGHCGAAVPLPVNDSMRNDEAEWQFIARKLETRGWRVGKSRQAHRCPKCLKAAKFAGFHHRKPEGLDTANEMHSLASTALATATVGHLNGAITMKVVENTRTLTREDRRIILAKLNEVYIDEKVGYGPGWTDERVATDLGVPRAWVRLLREENFGDEVSNEGIREQLKEAQKLLVQVRAVEPEMRRLMGLADKIERQLADIQKVFK